MALRKMLSLLLMFVAAATALSLSEQRCLRTQGRHKPAPSKEGLYDCHHFNENSCCTHNTTRVFVNSSAVHVGNYFWTKCAPGVSASCEEYIKNEMCFYYCSPNTYPWAKKITSSTENAADDLGETYSGVPICSTYCDSFYEACRTEPICVENWYTDWDIRRNNATGQNDRYCKASSTCQTFGDRFNNGKDLCNKIFGDSYVYTTGADCLVMSFENATSNPNDVVAARLANSAASSMSAIRRWNDLPSLLLLLYAAYLALSGNL